MRPRPIWSIWDHAFTAPTLVTPPSSTSCSRFRPQDGHPRPRTDGREPRPAGLRNPRWRHRDTYGNHLRLEQVASTKPPTAGPTPSAAGSIEPALSLYCWQTYSGPKGPDGGYAPATGVKGMNGTTGRTALILTGGDCPCRLSSRPSARRRQALQQQAAHPSPILCGTSAGAINAAGLPASPTTMQGGIDPR